MGSNMKGPGPWEIIVNASTIGLHLVSATFIGLAIGYYLEEWLCEHGWCYKPWVMLFWLVSGIGAGFKNIYLEIKKIDKAQQERDKGPQDNDAEKDKHDD